MRVGGDRPQLKEEVAASAEPGRTGALQTAGDLGMDCGAPGEGCGGATAGEGGAAPGFAFATAVEDAALTRQAIGGGAATPLE
jgi:hypothetical protein